MSTDQIKFSGIGNSLAVEMHQAKEIALKYRYEYVDLATCSIDYSLIHSMPVDLMIRHHFVPLQSENGVMRIAMADPTNLDLIDELSAQLKIRLLPCVATPAAIQEVLKRSDTSQRVLQDATQDFRISLIKETDQGEEDIDLDRLSAEKRYRRSYVWSIRSY